MNRARAVVDELPRGPLEETKTLEWTVGEVNIRLNLADKDRLGCLLDRAELKPGAGVELELDPAGIACTFTYLGESLAVIEHAKDEGKAILRSNPPLLEGSRIEYYELVIDRREGLSLGRYLCDSVCRTRVPIPAPLTTQALNRLIDDLKRLAAGTGTKARSH